MIQKFMVAPMHYTIVLNSTRLLHEMLCNNVTYLPLSYVRSGWVDEFRSGLREVGGYANSWTILALSDRTNAYKFMMNQQYIRSSYDSNRYNAFPPIGVLEIVSLVSNKCNICGVLRHGYPYLFSHYPMCGADLSICTIVL